MGASTHDQILEFIEQKVEFYKAVLAKKANSTSDFALSEVQETDNSGSLHLTGSNKRPSTQKEKDKYVQSQTQRERVFSDKDPVPKKWVSRDNEESHPRPHHGQDFVEAGKGVAELLRCDEISECQSNQLQQMDCDQSLRDCRANLPASQREATVFQSPNDFEVAPCWPRLQPEDTEDDGISPGMKESYANSEGSCETEDSCDYSSGEECKAVSRPLRKGLLQEATNPFENKNEDEVAKVQKAHNSFLFQRLKEIIVTKMLSENQRNGKQISNETSIITIESDSEDEHVTTSSGLDNFIVINSDTEDDSDQSTEKSTGEKSLPSVAEDNATLAITNQHDQMENKTAKNMLSSAGLQQTSSQCQNTPEDTLKDKPEGPCFDLLHGTELMESKDVCDKVENKMICSVTLERTKDSTSPDSCSDSRQSTPSSTKNRDQSREINSQSKLKILFKNSAKTLPHETASAQSADFLTTGWKKTDASEKSQLRFCRNKKGENLSKLNLDNPPKPSVHQNVEQQGTQSRHLSPTVGGDLSISTFSSISSSRGNFEAGQSSHSAESSSQLEEPTTTNCNRKKLKRVTFAPELHSPFKRLARSTSAPSTSETSATPASCHQVISTKGFSPCTATKSSPRMKVREDWMKTHYPIRIGRKHYHGVEQNVETTDRTMETTNHTSNTDSDGPVRSELAQHSEAPRQRRRSQDSNTSLMKRCKNEAMMWCKAINRQPTQTKRFAVGVGYKWSEKPSAAKSTEGFGIE